MRPPPDDDDDEEDQPQRQQTRSKRTSRTTQMNVRKQSYQKRKTLQIMFGFRMIGTFSLLMILMMTIVASNMTPLSEAFEVEEKVDKPTAENDHQEMSPISIGAHNQSSHRQLNEPKPLLANQAEQNLKMNPRDNQRAEEPQRSSGLVRQSRIYRIRTVGSNGSFASSVLRLNPPQSQLAPARSQESTDDSRPIEEPAIEREPRFGTRQQQASAKLAIDPGLIKMSSQQKAAPCGSSTSSPSTSLIESETAAEASSISASSQTLRLTSKPTASSQQQQLAASQHSATSQQHQATRGELDESLLAPQLVAANEPQQTAESGGGIQADRPASFPTGDQQQQRSTAAVESILSLIDEFDSKITTNKTEAQLSCDSGEMVIRLNFTDPFRGVVYPDHNRLSPCRFFGDGHHNYELRLPLRGCGTRQVAQRVFVNDVIVRFHKTLELEEDEVKTLICRYPPPLDAANSNQAAGSGLVHELGSSIDSNRRPSLTSAGESHLGHHQQPFELVDPASGRPTNRLGIGQHTQETFGELLAPSSGRTNLSPAERILFRQHQNQNDQLLSTSSSGVKQLNSRLFQPPEPSRTLATGGDQRTSSSTNSSGNFFDRLTSIELLFLISSLMFLVLLAFGLAGGYYCFSRRNRRESPTGPKLLGRHRRRSYFNSPASLLATTDTTTSAAGTTGPPYKHSHYRHQRGPSGGGHFVAGSGRLQPTTYNNQDVYAGAVRNPTSYYQRYLQQTQTAPSSPDDSDISGQNLLPATSASADDATRYNYLQSSVAPAASAHYQSSTLRPHYNHLQQGGVVVGRRQAPDVPSEMPNQQFGGRRTFQHQDRPRFGSATLRSSATEFESSTNQRHQQPSLSATGGASTLGRRANRLATLNQREPPVNEYQARHHHQHRHSHAHHHHQLQPQLKRAPLPLASQTIAANLYYAQMRHAKSLQQLRGDHSEMDQDNCRLDEEWRRQSNGAQEQNYLNDDKIRHKQQQHFFDTSTLARSSTGVKRKESSEFRVLDLSGGSTSSASDSEIELTNDRQNEQHQQQQHQTERPKLILKSIEDSFVTNLTEIYEQEYMKRDTTRPFSMAEWRSKQPDRQLGNPPTSTGAQQVNIDDSEDEDTCRPSPTDGEQSGQTNLRSLTELDVNFAKSLLRSTLVEQPKRETVRMLGDGQHQKQDCNSAKVGGPNEKATTGTSLTGPRQGAATSKQSNSMDDLVISPEYNCGQLKLRQDDKERKRDGASSPGNSSSASHESISYV